MVDCLRYFLVMAVLSGTLLATLAACGPVAMTESDLVEGSETPVAGPSATPPPASTPPPTRVPSFATLLTPTPVPSFATLLTPTPVLTATAAPTPLPEAQLSLAFDDESAGAGVSELVRIGFMVTNVSPERASNITLAFEVGGPATLALAHLDEGSCAEATCELDALEGHSSVTGFVVMRTQLGSRDEVIVDGDLSWHFGDQAAGLVHARVIIALVEEGYLGDLIWATGVDATAGSCAEFIQVGPKRVYLAYGTTLYSYAKSNGEEMWQAFGGGWHFLPELAEGSIYVGVSVHSPVAEYIRSLDALDGTLNWEHLVDGNPRGSAAVYDGNVFYTVNTHDGDGPARRDYLMSLGASNGSLAWRFPVDEWISTSAVEHGGTIYFGAYGAGQYLYAVDPKSGELSRRYATHGSLYHAPDFAGDSAYIVTASSLLYSMDLSTGEVGWKHRPEGRVTGTPLVSGGNVYVRVLVDEDKEHHAIHALDAATGSLQWEYAPGQALIQPSASGGRVYVPSYGAVVALDALTGMPEGHFLFDSNCRPVTVVDGVLYGNAGFWGRRNVFAIQVE